MPDERHFPHAFQVAAVAAGALAAECAIVRAVFMPGLAWWIPMAAHLAVTGALALWCGYVPGLRADVRLPLLLAAGTAALGPVGPLGTLVTLALARWYMREATPFEEWYRSLFPDTRQQAGDELAERAAAANLDDPASLTPFADVLAFGSIPQKQALIALINQSFRPAFGPILKRALTDGNNAVRVQAATAMNRLENGMLERTLHLCRKASEHPGERDSLRALARHYDSYLYTGILDARREVEVRERALEVYRQLVAGAPDDVDSCIALSRLLLRGGRYSEAADWLERAMQAGHLTPQADLWYMEALYHLGRFGELQLLARSRQGHLEGAPVLPSAALEAVRLWGAGEAVGGAHCQ